MGAKAGSVQTTPAQAALADHALSQLQDYRRRWLPVQMKLASTIQNEGKADSAERKLAVGKGSTDVATAFGKANGAVEKTLANAGVSPGSPRGALALSGMGGDEAGSMGLSHMMGEQAIDDAYTQGLGALMSEGQGQRGAVGQNMSTEAAASAQQAQADASASLMQREAVGGAIGQAGGLGMQQMMKGGFQNPFDTGISVDKGGEGIGTMGRSPSAFEGVFGGSAPGGMNGNNFAGSPAG
jgi:hypothetical protein